METIKVNMSPNPLDVQTIHASQNDGEARQWEFELHNNGELIDTSEVTEQMFFKAYKGGTEEILPTNGSVPTTAPFLGDIRYPQGLLTDQEFTYRQSPTESDGLAKITDIKGNTLVWNQLVQNGNFESTSGWAFNNCSGSTSNNVCNISVTAGTKGVNFGLSSANAVNKVIGHKYLFAFNVKVSVLKTSNLKLNLGGSVYVDIPLTANVDTRYSTIFSATETSTRFFVYPWGTFPVELVGDETVNVHDYMCIDLTQMFGTGNEPTTVEEFTSLFPLSYYSYNQGSLLSFNGNGIKTTGKNLLPYPYLFETVTRTGITMAVNTDGSIKAIGTNTSSVVQRFDLANITLEKGSYIFTGFAPQNGAYGTLRDRDSDSWIMNIGTNNPLTVSKKTNYRITLNIVGNASIDTTYYPLIRFADADSSYEPYTSSTLSLPISTYFSSGMKSAGTVYDELTPTKAITRIGAVDLSTINYTYDGECFIGKIPDDAKVLSANTETLNSVSDRYLINNWSSVKYLKSNMTLGTGVSRYICIFNNSYTDATAFKTAMSGVYLYYELATPTETSFTTASLVTENGEIPLFNEDGVLIGKCTEQLSSESGFFDAKIKLSDSDGTCYSNKLQLHVERSPQ